MNILGLNTTVYADCYGGGDSTSFSVMSEKAKSFFISRGIPKKKITVVGHPLLENLYYNSQTQNTKSIVYATGYRKPGYKKYLSDKETLEARIKLINELSCKFNQYDLIVKLHPKEVFTEFKDIESINRNVKLEQDVEINKLISDCSVFISRASTSVLYALVLKKPVISFNFPKLPMGDYYKDIGGTLHANSLSDIINYIEKIINKDKNIMTEIENRRNKFLKNIYSFTNSK